MLWTRSTWEIRKEEIIIISTKYLKYLVPSTCGTEYLWYQVLGTKYLVPSTSTWYQVLGLVLSTWYQALGTKYLGPSTRLMVDYWKTSGRLIGANGRPTAANGRLIVD